MIKSLIKKRINLADLGHLRKVLRHAGVHTVCESARCPNIGECFCKGTATFLIAGTVCTRNCRFCAIDAGNPQPLDPHEPGRVAGTVRRLNLKYAIITSVTRDDIDDGGARHFVLTVAAVRAGVPDVRVEVLVPDFAGKRASATVVFDCAPDVFAHNLETVPRLYARVRPGADYRRSLSLLAAAKDYGLITKSGIMLGLGERESEVLSVMDDLRYAGCDMLTLGQYLSPSKTNLPVTECVPLERFEKYHRTAISKGFRHCASAPYVRSSYSAESAVLSI